MSTYDEFHVLGRGLYDDLNISQDCSYDDLKQSYQKLILLYHPDKSRSSDTKQFTRIHDAWRVLSNEILRKEYDRFLLKTSPSSSVVMNTVMLSDFLIIYDNENNDVIQYKKVCRCGGYYIMTKRELDEGYNTMQCDNCSLEITII